MFEAIGLTEHINRVIKEQNGINAMFIKKIEALEKRIEMLEERG